MSDRTAMHSLPEDAANSTGLPQLPHALREVFVAFEQHAVPYVVLRGFDPLSELVSSLDIDVFIPSNSLETARAVLEQSGWNYRRFQTGLMPHVFFDRWDGESGLVRSFDVVTALCYGPHAHRLLAADNILKSSVLFSDIRVPAPWMTAFCFALHVVLDKESLSEANGLRADGMRERCRAELSGRNILSATFGSDAAEFTDAFFAWAARPTSSTLPALRSRAYALGALSSQTLAARVHQLRARWRQLRRPVGRVAILGIDGSGKSTLVEMASQRSGTIVVHGGYLGHNLYRTPPAKWLTRSLEKTRREQPRAQLRIRILANLEVLWRPVELAVRMLIAEHRAEMVLYDRFPLGQDDGEPTTLWGRVVRWYTVTTRRLLPAPDLVVLLDGDDNVIWSRKKEMPFEQHQSTQAQYRQLIRLLPFETATIRTDGRIEESFSNLQKALSESASIAEKLYGRKAVNRSTE